MGLEQATRKLATCTVNAEEILQQLAGVCTENLNADVMVMQSAQDGRR
jgi:hypothetical protein